MLSKFYKSQPAAVNAVTETIKEWHRCQARSVDELNEMLWRKEVYRMSTAEKEEEVRVILESAARAKEPLSCEILCGDAVWLEGHSTGTLERSEVQACEPRVGSCSGLGLRHVLPRRHLCRLLVKFM